MNDTTYIAQPSAAPYEPAASVRRRPSRVRSLVSLLVILAVGLFAYLNWEAILEPTTLSVGVTTVEAPLGLILLSLLVIIALPLMIYAAYLRRSATVQTGELLQELQTQRHLADRAEQSRFTELRKRFDEGMRESANRENTLRNDLLARIDRLEASLASVDGEKRSTVQIPGDDPTPLSLEAPADGATRLV